MDVHLTRDGEIVVIHDPSVDRTTEGTGAVGALTCAEIQQFDAGYRFLDLDGVTSFRGRGVRIPRFADLLDALPGVRMNVDAKDREAAPELVKLLKMRGDEHRVLLAASEGEWVRSGFLGYRGPTSATRGQIRLFYLLHRLPGGGPYTPRTDALQIPFVFEGRQVTTPRLIREAHRRNIPVHVWTINDRETMELLLDWGVDGIQTDRLDLLAQVLHEKRGRPLPPGLLGGGAGGNG
jgi:glycerophosphoryl diester phosphodiesterase